MVQVCLFVCDIFSWTFVLELYISISTKNFILEESYGDVEAAVLGNPLHIISTLIINIILSYLHYRYYDHKPTGTELLDWNKRSELRKIRHKVRKLEQRIHTIIQKWTRKNNWKPIHVISFHHEIDRLWHSFKYQL